MLLCYFNSHPSFLGLYIIVIVDLTHITIDPK
jgi:hypothetical protein